MFSFKSSPESGVLGPESGMASKFEMLEIELGPLSRTQNSGPWTPNSSLRQTHRRDDDVNDLDTNEWNDDAADAINKKVAP